MHSGNATCSGVRVRGVLVSLIQSRIGALEVSSQFAVDTICCYPDAEVSRWISIYRLSGERLLAAQALQLLIGLDQALREARADWNQDRFRRVMQARSKAVARVRRRWHGLNPAPAIQLGKLRRRYHASLAGYLYGMENRDTDSENEDNSRAYAPPACNPSGVLPFVRRVESD
jgi:hypothetical protein